MNIVVIGGSGLIGSMLVTTLREHGHEVKAPSPYARGVNTITGEGLPDVLIGASVVIDVSNSPSYEDAAVMEFFPRSTRNLLQAENAAGVGHHVALSVVGSERLTESAYMRAKIAQETLVKESSIPYSIVRATQFFEFVKSIADASTDGDTVPLAALLIQPIAADDVAAALGKVAVAPPVHGLIEIAGPNQFRLDEFIRRGLSSRNDPRGVVSDPHARYFGAELSEHVLLPGNEAHLAPTHFEDWLSGVTAPWTPALPARRAGAFGLAKFSATPAPSDATFCTAHAPSTARRHQPFSSSAQRRRPRPQPTTCDHPVHVRAVDGWPSRTTAKARKGEPFE